MRIMKSMSLLITACVTLAAGGTFAAPPEEAGQGRWGRAAHPVPGEYIVVLKEKPSPALPDVAVKARSMARQYGGEVLHTYGHAFRGFVFRASEAQALKLAKHPQVEYVQENGFIPAAGTQSPAPWNLDRIDQATLPLNNTYFTDDATGINVYVVDSGIRSTHTEFAGRVQNVYNYYSTEGDVDCIGHGTRTAGIIGGATWGVAKKVALKSVRVVDCLGRATTASIAAGLEYVAAHGATPAVVNLSFASLTIDPTIDAAATAVVNRQGLVLVAAAGNAGEDACGSSPAHLAGVITVAATDQSDFRWLNSNYGSCVKLFAPGVEIPSADHTSDDDATLGDGTSWAAPHVAGVAAFLLANNIPASDILTKLIADSSVGVVTDAGPGSPNNLLVKRPVATAIPNGVPVSVNDIKDGIKNFSLVVPSGRPSVVFSISGGTGDADLYVRYGAVPETYVYHCRPLRAGNNETCSFTNPKVGTWYIQLRAYAAYSTSLKGQY
jgi:serine protease